MRTHNLARKGFTLIEILIVVVILGILAAIVIPQFTDASDQANVASMKSQLQTLRSQIELYRVQEPVPFATFDPATDGWVDMINGDYLRDGPRNPITGSSAVAAAAPGAPTTTLGWVWRLRVGSTLGLFNLYGIDEDGNEFDESR
ncbi:MAG: prepilin-type N-terminal cleavage/methylation domain-containing protein [Planctomycetota bacterium]|nr:prepilin-type N-terminal cleavage/methylation domain-containing protein [Planctomycetota bacterium]